MLEGNKTLSKAWLRFCHRSSFGLFRDLKPRGWGEFDFFLHMGIQQELWWVHTIETLPSFPKTAWFSPLLVPNLAVLSCKVSFLSYFTYLTFVTWHMGSLNSYFLTIFYCECNIFSVNSGFVLFLNCADIKSWNFICQYYEMIIIMSKQYLIGTEN